MEIQEFAARIFEGDRLEDKLFAPEGGIRALTDEYPGKPVSWHEPGRSGQLLVAKDVRHKRLPRPGSFHDPVMRVRCLHTFANHELMALEMMAWALLAFPDAPRAFRIGLLKIVEDEQEHFRMYSDHIASMGTRFGELPINDHFWRIAPEIDSPAAWVCAMHLTFEQSNLDHAPFYRDGFEAVGAEESANLMQKIVEDEIMHVRFGGHWLRKYKLPEQSLFDAFLQHLGINNPPHRARGTHFNAAARREAGLDEEFIQAIESCDYETAHLLHSRYAPPLSPDRKNKPKSRER